MIVERGESLHSELEPEGESEQYKLAAKNGRGWLELLCETCGMKNDIKALRGKEDKKILLLQTTEDFVHNSSLLEKLLGKFVIVVGEGQDFAVGGKVTNISAADCELTIHSVVSGEEEIVPCGRITQASSANSFPAGQVDVASMIELYTLEPSPFPDEEITLDVNEPSAEALVG